MNYNIDESIGQNSKMLENEKSSIENQNNQNLINHLDQSVTSNDIYNSNDVDDKMNKKQLVIKTDTERLRSGSNTEVANSPLNVKEMNKKRHQRGGTIL